MSDGDTRPARDAAEGRATESDCAERDAAAPLTPDVEASPQPGVPTAAPSPVDGAFDDGVLATGASVAKPGINSTHDVPDAVPVRAWPARAKAAALRLTGAPDETSALRPGQTASDAVPNTTARTVTASSFGDRAADVLATFADRLLSDKQISDENLVSGTVGDAAPTSDVVMIQAPERAATRRRSGEAVTASPVLSLPRATNPEAIALFVHGGDVEGSLRMHRADPAFVRMVPFARDVERRSHGRVGGALLRLAVRGWNDPEKPAVEDTRWALGELRRRFPGRPIAVVGHSMGGRVVLDIAADEQLDAVVALAPWAAHTYEADAFTDVPLLGIHGRHDTVTDPKATKDLVDRVQTLGGDARFVSMPGWHAMLWNPVRWHREASTFLIDHLLPDAPA